MSRWNEVNDDEKFISIWDMIFYLLHRWKFIVIAVVIGAVLAGGLTFAKSYADAKKGTAGKGAETVTLTPDEMAAMEIRLETIEEYLTNIKEYDGYLQNSIRMKLDPNGYYEGSIRYLFIAENSADALKALNACYQQVFSSESYEELSGLLKDQPTEAALRECFTLEAQPSVTWEQNEAEGENYKSLLEDLKDFSMNEDTSADTQEKQPEILTRGERTVLWNITFSYYDQAECEKVMEFVLEQMETVIGQVAETASVQEIGHDVHLTSDVKLIKESHQLEAAKEYVYSAIEELEEDMTTNQRKYYEQYMAGDSQQEETVAAVPGKAKVDWKYVILAAVAAGGCVGVLLAGMYLFGNYIHGKEELAAYVEVPVIGLSGETQDSRKNKIDCLVDQLESRVRKGKEDTKNMAAAMLCSYAKQSGMEKVYLTGTAVGKNKELFSELCAETKKSGVELLEGKSILEDTTAVTDATNCGCIVLWEKCNKTSYRDLREELKKAGYCDLKVLGIVLEK